MEGGRKVGENDGGKFRAQYLILCVQVSVVERLRGRQSELCSMHVREVAKKEAEREIVLDDLEALNDQYQQLNMAFETQVAKLAEAKVRWAGNV